MIRSILLAGAAVAVSTVHLGCGGGGNCAEGATKHAETGVCLKVPADFKIDDKVMKAGDNTYLQVRNTKTFKSFTIWIEKPENDLDKRAGAVANMASGDLKLTASGDTSPNKGKFFHFHNGAGDYDFAVVLVPGKQHFYRCEIQNTPPADAAPMVEACKSVGGP